ncbi:IclR family transcriptional regulator domain-containing protein [Halomontanus rarus]|uniref:IclR family transcriptional regulator domain-containing protein n=1 Tax=Halomontanus rarus TaxID=3034020 RepID=UPI001A97DAC9
MKIDDFPEEGARSVTTVETNFRLLEALRKSEGAGVTELADELSLTKSTVHKHLTTLRKLGYIVKEGTTYRLGISLLGLGTAARSQLPFYETAKEPLEKLSDTTDEVATLVVPEHGYGVYAFREGPVDDRKTHRQAGARIPLHRTAGGKAILAYTPTEIRDRIFRHRDVKFDSEERDTLARELQNIRDTRTAYDRGEYIDDWYCVAVPITDADRNAVGAVTVSGPADRMEGKLSRNDIPNLIGHTANSIQNRLRSN